MSRPNTAFLNVRLHSSVWPTVIAWLDDNCPTWKFAHNHSTVLYVFRSNSHTLADVYERPIWLSEIDAAKFKLAHDTSCIVRERVFPLATPAERLVGALMAEYNGPADEFSVELMDVTTMNIIRKKVRDRQRSLARQKAARKETRA